MMRTIKELDCTGSSVVVGRHSIWVPSMGLKIPFQYGGQVTKYGLRERSYPAEESIAHELAILRCLAAHEMAPPVNEPVWVETLISGHRGAWHADPIGAWAYEMEDANGRRPGRFDFEAMRRLPIEGSPGAWGDIGKPGNVVNGYLVDVRRSAWDMLRWAGPLPTLSRPVEPPSDLAARVHRDGQFPAGQRPTAYQDFYLAGQWHTGERRVVERAHLLGFDPRPGQSVVEIGCQTGGFLQLAALAGATAIGIESVPAYVDLARALARHMGENICIRRLDAVKEAGVMVEWIRSYFPAGVDHLLLLSMEKHLGVQHTLDLAAAIGARKTYLETNAVCADDGSGPAPQAPMKIRHEVEAMGGRYIGDSRDRNLRRLYLIER